MANLTPAEVGKLVQEIDELRRTAEGTLIDQAALTARYDAATANLLTPEGKFDLSAWANLSDADRATREDSLTSLRQALGHWEQDIPIPPASIMYKKYASNGAIIVLTLVAFLGLIADLWMIRCHWNKATSGKTVMEAPRDEVKPKSTDTIPSSPTADTDTTPAVPVTGTTPATASREPGEPKITGLDKPTEESVLFMVILMGALGGFLHLASSMANYVGNRQLLRSWIIYYFLIPVQGAALAPVVYLLLRVGVLNPANTAPGDYSPADSLNLIGIYAFAALTGLFSKQAIEMLADVFSTIFKKVNAKDGLEKSKPDAATTAN
jgi:hypothetical protein